jgi:hypothetical protein
LVALHKSALPCRSLAFDSISPLLIFSYFSKKLKNLWSRVQFLQHVDSTISLYHWWKMDLKKLEGEDHGNMSKINFFRIPEVTKNPLHMAFLIKSSIYR